MTKRIVKNSRILAGMLFLTLSLAAVFLAAAVSAHASEEERGKAPETPVLDRLESSGSGRITDVIIKSGTVSAEIVSR